MSRLRKRRVRLELEGRHANDPHEILKAIEAIARPLDLTVIVRDTQNLDSAVPDEHLETIVRAKVESLLDEKAMALANRPVPSESSAQSAVVSSSNQIVARRARVIGSIRGLIKGAWSVTIKAVTSAFLEHSGPR